MEADCQVILTTHSPGLASELPAESIRFISRDEHHVLSIQDGAPVFGSIADTLGVTPDSRVKALFCVEGPTDVEAFKALSSALHKADPTIPDLSTDERVAFVVMGGSTLVQWVSQHYLKGLGRKELHIYDRDVPAYEIAEAEVNGRNNGSWACRTSKHEIECYLHTDAIMAAYGVSVPVVDHPPTKAESVGSLFGKAYSAAQAHDGVMGEGKSKGYLARKAFPLMTAQWIDERDPAGEVKGWFNRLAAMLN